MHCCPDSQSVDMPRRLALYSRRSWRSWLGAAAASRARMRRRNRRSWRARLKDGMEARLILEVAWLDRGRGSGVVTSPSTARRRTTRTRGYRCGWRRSARMVCSVSCARARRCTSRSAPGSCHRVVPAPKSCRHGRAVRAATAEWRFSAGVETAACLRLCCDPDV